jgi:hypothetical protein
MSFQKAIAEIASNIISVDCTAQAAGSASELVSLFYLKKLTYASVPVLAFITPFVMLRLWKFLASRYKWREISDEAFNSMLITSVIVILFFMHPTLTQQSFLMLSCVKLGVDPTDYFLVEDMDERCWGAKHISWLLGLCLPMLLFYVVGIPVVACYILYLNRADLESAQCKRRYFFLYTGYRFDRWYWEFVIVLRKLVLITITVYLQDSIRLQAFACLALIAFSLGLHIHFRPFMHPNANKIEIVSLLVSFGTFFAGIMLWTPYLPQTINFITLGYVLLANIGFLLMWAYFSWQSFKLLMGWSNPHEFRQSTTLSDINLLGLNFHTSTSNHSSQQLRTSYAFTFELKFVQRKSNL